MLFIANVDINRIKHVGLQWFFRSACLKMLRTVGKGKSFLG